MKLKLVWLGVALLAAFAAGRCGGGPTAAERALADTLRVQGVALQQQAWTNDSLRLLLQNASHSLTTHATAAIAPARLHTDTVVTDSDSSALRVALKNERAACDIALAASGKETHVAQWAAVSVAAERDAALRLQVRTQGALDAALRVRRSSSILLGVTVGYGGAWSGGRVMFGPSVNAGVTFKISLPRIL